MSELFDEETPAERQGRPQPFSDDQIWEAAMRAYEAAKNLGAPRLQASSVFQPLLSHDGLASAAKIMLDIARRFPE